MFVCYPVALSVCLFCLFFPCVCLYLLGQCVCLLLFFRWSLWILPWWSLCASVTLLLVVSVVSCCLLHVSIILLLFEFVYYLVACSMCVLACCPFVCVILFSALSVSVVFFSPCVCLYFLCICLLFCCSLWVLSWWYLCVFVIYCSLHLHVILLLVVIFCYRVARCICTCM